MSTSFSHVFISHISILSLSFAPFFYEISMHEHRGKRKGSLTKWKKNRNSSKWSPFGILSFFTSPVCTLLSAQFCSSSFSKKPAFCCKQLLLSISLFSFSRLPLVHLLIPFVLAPKVKWRKRKRNVLWLIILFISSFNISHKSLFSSLFIFLTSLSFFRDSKLYFNNNNWTEEPAYEDVEREKERENSENAKKDSNE